MSASFQYRLIYNDEIDPAFMCTCPALYPCENCSEVENGSEWFDLPLYRLSRFNKYIPENGIYYPEDIADLIEELHTDDDFDDDFNDKKEAFQVFEELYYKSDGYIVQIHYE